MGFVFIIQGQGHHSDCKQVDRQSGAMLLTPAHQPTVLSSPARGPDGDHLATAQGLQQDGLWVPPPATARGQLGEGWEESCHRTHWLSGQCDCCLVHLCDASRSSKCTHSWSTIRLVWVCWSCPLYQQDPNPPPLAAVLNPEGPHPERRLRICHLVQHLQPSNQESLPLPQ